VPGEANVIADLLSAKMPEEIRRICKDAFTTAEREVKPGEIREVAIANWPISVSSVLPSYLCQYAAQFIAARKDRRFPKSTTRPSSRLKQIWFLSRALAGALFGVTTRTAINLVGSKMPDKIFEESRAAKPRRAKQKKKGRRAH
jgi:hypothetical protein